MRWTGLFVLAHLGLASSSALSAQTPSHQSDCKPLRLTGNPGTAHAASTLAPKRFDGDGAPDCYLLMARPGTTVNVKVDGDQNATMTIPGVGDARSEFEFVTNGKPYRISVFQLFMKGTPTAYSLAVRAEGGAVPNNKGAKLRARQSAKQSSCKTLQLGRRPTVSTSSTLAPKRFDGDGAPDCYSLVTVPGQKLEIKIEGGENAAMTIPGVGDARSRVEFVPRQQLYTISVFQLFNKASPTNYSLIISRRR